jgi:hypothetical protein
MDFLPQEELDFLERLSGMHHLFWRSLNIEAPEKSLSYLKKQEIHALYEKYSEALSTEKIKETIKLLLDYRSSCYDASVAAHNFLYPKIEEQEDGLYHYSPPNIIHCFKLVPPNFNYDESRSLSRFYSRKKNIKKVIEHSTHNIGNIPPNYSGWAFSGVNIPKNVTRSLEAEDYLAKSKLLIQSNLVISQVANNFFVLMRRPHIVKNFVVFNYLDKKFCIDFQTSDILLEDEFVLPW